MLAGMLAMAVSLLIAAPLGSARGGDDGCGDSRSGGDRGRSDDHRGDRDRIADLDVIGLTADARLICFESDDPGDARTIGNVTGLVGDARLVGIDYRPSNSLLYGVGNAGGAYTINDDTAVATKVGQLTVALAGASFGVDVNPAADALRIISDTGQNLRFSFALGTTTMDVTLTYPPSTTPATGVTGAGYTNNDLDPNTATTLYDVDSMLDQVAIQSPANSGQLAATGKLGVDTTSTIGFDVYSTIRNGTTVDLDAFASLTVGGQARFYAITLFTGRAESLGSFSSRNQVIAIAIPLNQL